MRNSVSTIHKMLAVGSMDMLIEHIESMASIMRSHADKISSIADLIKNHRNAENFKGIDKIIIDSLLPLALPSTEVTRNFSDALWYACQTNEHAIKSGVK